MQYYLYILYSEAYDKYYIGYTSDYEKRLELHNSSRFNTFTSKYRPWKIKALFKVGNSKTKALQLERFIKKQKSRSLLEKLIDVNFIPTGKLSDLHRVNSASDG